MKIAHKAVWLIESRLKEPLSLDAIAAKLGVSAFHLARAFSSSHGMMLMKYVRRRRLMVAARQLVDSEARVIDVALDAGYGSQEAFTRAFSAEFQVPPQVFRHHHRQAPFEGVEAILMKPNSKIELRRPRTVSADAFRLVGLARRYNEQTSAQIPDQWAKFNEMNVAESEDKAAYGVCYNSDTNGNLDYLCAVKVANFDEVAADLDRLTIPALRLWGILPCAENVFLVDIDKVTENSHLNSAFCQRCSQRGFANHGVHRLPRRSVPYTR